MASSTEIKPATPAMVYFRRDVDKVVREELQAQGAAIDIGSVQREVTARWAALPDDQRVKYLTLAADDKARYQAEAAQRDAQAEEDHARKRADREALVVSGPRSTRTPGAAAAAVPSEAKPRREVSEAEADRRRQAAEKKAREREESRAEKDKVDGSIKSQQSAIKKAIAEQAEARLQYLLKQSDIFSHFGVGKERAAKKKAEEEAAAAAGGAAAGGPRKRGRGAKGDDDDARGGRHRREDEDASDGESGGEEEEEEGSSAGASSTFLTSQPASIQFGKLRHYQLEGLNWMIRLNNNGINGILADEMGLGKTLQSISILAYMFEHKGIRGPHIILVPKSTLSNWMNEFARWCPVLRAVKFHGTRDERAHQVDTILKPGSPEEERTWDVLVTTYEVSNMEKKVLQKFAWRYLIIDEAHRLKNEASLFSQTVRSLNMQHRLLLTGTPLQNNLHELWALLNFLLPDVFSSAEQFDEWFNLEIDDKEAKARMIQQLHKILRPFMLRRLKADVEKSLPPKNETILFVGMSAKQKEVYRNVLLRDIDAVNGSGGGGGVAGRTAILNIVMQLRKCCNHPYLFAGVEDRSLDPLGEHLVQNCGKMVLLSKLLGKLFERGNRVLIFSQMTRMLDILEDFCLMRRYEYCRIDGGTSYENREDFIDAYNRPGSTKFIFMLSTRAGGLGINLQTADTVILYDSDWNPQADLQAMDRAHRIGQKNTVNVYRFVTENTVEEKVVERAQQKLKMDAMIVQQGRLQEQSNKKFSKDELLEAIRFGADSVFRTKESSISDEDIDAILAAGEKRTKEIEARISKADKGDMLDFRLDGGLETQRFEGVDYSNRANRIDTSGPFYIDTGKRERKKVQSYVSQETLGSQRAQTNAKKRSSRLPKHLRLPKMDEWQFYDRKRLTELYEMEEELYARAKQEGKLPNASEMADLQLLPPELAVEKAQLLAQGFSDWTKPHYQLFVRASAKYGRTEVKSIAVEVGKTEAEVARYAEAFWTLGATALAPAEWERHLRNVERGEKKIEEISRLMDATRTFVARFRNPWEQLTFQYAATSQGKVFNAPEDRYLLCLAHQYGYGAWDQVKAAIRRSGRFRFDYFLRSCSADALGKRCEALMRAAEKENAEWDKRHAPGATERPGEREKALEEERRRAEELERNGKLAEFEARLRDEARKLAELRASKQKKKQAALAEAATTAGGGMGSGAGAAGGTAGGVGGGAEDNGAASASGGAAGGGGVGAGGAHKKTAGAGKPAAAAGLPRKSGGTTPAAQPKTVPDAMLPRLAQIIHGSGPKSIDKLATDFVFLHPETSKRQVEKKILEMADKEKRDGDQRDSWYLKPQYAALLQQAASLPADTSFGGGTMDAAAAAAAAAADGADGGDGGAGAAAPKSGKGGKKRKHEDSSGPRNPYSYFKEEYRERAVKELQEQEAVEAPAAEQVKAKLKEIWQGLDDARKDDFVRIAVRNGFKKTKT